MQADVHRPSALVVMLACVVAIGAAACTASSTADKRILPASTTTDCGPGYACTTGSVLVGYDFCAPAPDPCNETTCDGGCTADGTCLRGCDLYADGTAGPCPIEGTTCIRSSSPTRGVCYPVKSCNRSTDCPAGEMCLSQAVPDEMGDLPPNLYCVPNPSATMTCPPGYVYVPFLVEGGLCAPACSADLECPPTFGCLTIARVFGLTADPCFPGVIGTSCTDDTNCIFGQCLAFNGSGAKVCTLRCSEVEATPGATARRSARAISYRASARGRAIARSTCAAPRTRPASRATRPIRARPGSVSRRGLRAAATTRTCARRRA